MSHIVNFLPWRETRRRQRLQMAGLLILGLLLILLAALLTSRLNQRVSHSLETAKISAEDQLYTAFQQRERAMRARLQQQEQRRLRALRREKTAAWQPTLQAIASRMPEHAWLTLLEYRQNTLLLSGLTLHLKGLAEIEKALGSVAGFRPPMAGETYRDSEGRWLFHFSMAEEDDNAVGH